MTQEEDAHIINITGLTPEGYRRMYELQNKLDKEKLEKEYYERDRRRFCYDTVAIVISVLAFVISFTTMIKTLMIVNQ